MSQSLAEDDLLSVRTEGKSANGIISCSAYTLNDECDCFEIEGTGQPFRVQIWFPYATSVELNNDIVTNEGRNNSPNGMNATNQSTRFKTPGINGGYK